MDWSKAGLRERSGRDRPPIETDWWWDIYFFELKQNR